MDPDASRVPDGSVVPVRTERDTLTVRGEVTTEARYEEGALLGRGGMGVVRLVHDRVIGREVAMKRASSSDPQRVARILREAKIAATLEHPGIVPVHDVGVAADGAPFYTMRVVRGETLAAAIARAGNATARQRLVRHVLDAAQAVAYAHHRGVLHRDLKPTNVIVGEFGETQVVDWGLADFATSDERGGGTPRYMSPEQRAHAPVDARTDVWGLGMILAEVLTGVGPRDASIDWKALAKAPDEVRAIVVRALAPESRDRYPDAKAFADDLARYLDARPVAAHAYSLLGHLRRLWRAWRGALVVASVALVVVVVLTVIGVVRIVAERDRAVLAEGAANAQTELAEVRLGQALTSQALLHAAADSRSDAELTAARALKANGDDSAALGVLAAYAATARPVAVASVAMPTCSRVRLERDGRRLLCIDPDALSLWQRATDTAAFDRRWRFAGPIGDATLVSARDTVVFTDHRDRAGWLDANSGVARAQQIPWQYVRRLATSVSGEIALGWENNSVQALDVGAALATPGTRAASTRIVGCRDSGTPVVAVAFDDPAERVVIACEDGTLEDVALWTDARATARMPFGATRPEASAIVLLPDGNHVAVATRAGTLAVVAVQSGTIVREASVSGAITGLVADPFDDAIWIRPDAGQARLWDSTSGAWLDSLPVSLARHDLVPAPDGAVFTVGDAIRRWTITREALGQAQAIGISTLASSPSGRYLAWGDRDGVTLAERVSGRVVRRIDGLGRMVKSLAFSADERTLYAATVAAPFLARIDVAQNAAPVPLGCIDAVRRVGLVGDRWLVAVHYQEHLTLFDLADGAALSPTAQDRPLRAEIRDASFRRDGDHAALVDVGGQVFVLMSDPSQAPRLEPRGKPLAQGELPAQILATRDPDVVLVASGALGDLREVTFAPGSGGVSRTLWSDEARIASLAISDDDRWIAVGDVAGRVTLLDRSGAVRLTFEAHDDRVAAMSFVAISHAIPASIPAADELVTSGWDGHIRRLGLGVLDTPRDVLQSAIEASWATFAK